MVFRWFLFFVSFGAVLLGAGCGDDSGRSISGPEAYEIYVGQITVYQQEELEALRGIAEIDGNLDIRSRADSLGVMDLSPLESLQKVTGHLNILDTPIAGLTGLSQLREVGSLRIIFNNSLVDLQGLGSLQSAEIISIVSNESLSSLDGLEGLRSCTEFYLGSNGSLVDITALSSDLDLGKLTFEDRTGLTALPLNSGLGGLSSLEISSCDDLESLSGLGPLPSLAELSVHGCRALNSLEGITNQRLVRYCARPPLAQERLGRLNGDQLVYSLRKPTVDGRTELILTPLELLERLSKLVTPPRVHKHRYCGVLAPNARLRRAVIESAGPSGATLKILQEARREMGLEDTPGPDSDKPTGGVRAAAARCWALLLARIFECLPLRCPRCGEPMRIIAFVLDRDVIDRILDHIGEPTEPPAILPARSPPQGELDFARAVPVDLWPEVDQTADLPDDSWE